MALSEKKLASAKKYRSRPEIKERRKNWMIEYNKKYFARPEVKKHKQEYGKQYWLRPEVRERMKIWRAEYEKNNLGKHSLQNKIRNLNNKLLAFRHYGGNPPKCACCGETEIKFLSIDHINGGGSKHRKEMGAGCIANWLIKNNFPDGFQVLCMNCNFGKKMNGGICPHKTIKQEAVELV